MNDRDALRARTIDWAARLPLIGEPEIARLLGVSEHDARRLAHDLVRLGWLESLEPGSRELDPRRRYVLRAEAVPALADAVGVSKVERELPVRLRDTLHRVTQFEITVGVARLLADLADHVRRSGLGELADARSLPLGLVSREQWWLAGTSGYGCLREGTQWAPFMVAWDRAAAPDDHRRARVRAWANARADVARRWGPDGLATMLLVCPGERERAVWEQALLKRREEDPYTAPSVLLTTREALRVDGVGGRIWRRPGDRDARFLVKAIGWGSAPPITTSWLSDSPDRVTDLAPRQGESIRGWARAEMTRRAGGPIWRRIGAIAAVLEPGERAIVDWIARFELLAAADLAAFRNESAALVERRLERVVHCDLVCTAPLNDRSIYEREVRMDRDSEARYVLTEQGIRFLAERADVPVAVFRERGGIRPRKRRDGQHGAVRHVEHTIGTNRALAQFARDARASGGRLIETRNDAESAWSFTDSDGREYWIRPDASGIVELGGERFPFVLEYDRGTLDAGDFRGKFEGYRRFYARQAWRSRYPREPLLLFVCVDSRAESRVARALEAEAPELPALLTSEWRSDANPSNQDGLLGSIWNSPRPSSHAGALSPSLFRVRASI